MSVQRIDRLTAAPVLGQTYLVPTVRTRYFNKVADWPVLGPQHDDVEFFGFAAPHYHIDPRFLDARESRDRIARSVNGYVLHGDHHGRSPLPGVIWRRRKCARTWFSFDPPWNVNTKPLDALRKAFAGRQCRRNSSGFVCPHRSAPLGSIEAVDGVVTCPLHGLRINADTGIVIP